MILFFTSSVHVQLKLVNSCFIPNRAVKKKKKKVFYFICMKPKKQFRDVLEQFLSGQRLKKVLRSLNKP